MHLTGAQIAFPVHSSLPSSVSEYLLQLVVNSNTWLFHLIQVFNHYFMAKGGEMACKVFKLSQTVNFVLFEINVEGTMFTFTLKSDFIGIY